MLFFGCGRQHSKVEDVLEQSGENMEELQKVLDHFGRRKEDSLKLRAARFLIANMPNHYSYKDERLDKYNAIFDLIRQKESIKPYTGNYVFPETDMMWDSIAKTAGPLDAYSLNVVSDCQLVTAKLLIENIEYAFMAWDLPWSKHLTFDQFCEYVLPYRFQDEALESWRPVFWKKYAWLADSMKGSNDPLKACELVNRDIKRWFRFNGLFSAYPSAISAGNLLKVKMGKCLDQAAIACFAMRSMGIPVAHEFIPQWADRSMGHDFSAALSKEGTFVGFLGGELDPGSNEIRNRAPKIFRSTFSQQNNELLNAGIGIEEVPYLLRSLFQQDVTAQYVPISSVRISLGKDVVKKQAYLYLAVFNDREWIPVTAGRVNGTSVVFSNIGRNIVYLPVLIADGRMQEIAAPFQLTKSGAVHSLEPNLVQTRALHLERKYPLQGYKLNWLKWMGGGAFQGANLASFADAVTIYQVPDSISMSMHQADVKKPQMFRYLRYLFPDNSSGSLSEIAFYNENGNDLAATGKKISAKGVDSADLAAAFDRKFETYIDRTPNYEYNGLWIGLDLNMKQKVKAVGYSPRNDRNGVIKGMKYVLMYWDKGWRAIGTKVATEDNHIEFPNAPANSLFLLKNLTEGKEERLFVYTDNKQEWF